MKVVYWLRSRQEERELAYWLAIVAYEKSDHSFNNRVYLLYLILFFGVWVFVTLTFFASGGALLFKMINPEDPVQIALLVEILLLGIWSLYSTWRAVRRCPVLFSEEDGLLLSQTPIPRSNIILRWLLMPWLKSAIPFWIVAVTLGIPSIILLESFLGFLGFAVKPPLISWGLMLQDTGTFSVIGSYPWILSPVGFVLVAVFAFNALGDGLRDAIDPY